MSIIVRRGSFQSFSLFLTIVKKIKHVITFGIFSTPSNKQLVVNSVS